MASPAARCGCHALIASHDGVGMPLAPTILAELGDAVVGHTGLDVTVSSSQGKRSPGQGSQVLRWAFELSKPPKLRTRGSSAVL